MELKSGTWRSKTLRSTVLSNLPIVVALFVLISWLLASNEIYTADRFGLWSLVDPVSYILSIFMHSDWGHFTGNMWLWIPFGTLFTLLTSNRHLLVVAVMSHVLTQIASNALFRFGVGMSVVVLAVGAAILVRSIAIAYQDASMETLQFMLIMLVPPLLLGFAMIFIIAGPSSTGHFEHFLGAVFGAAIETIYVFNEHETSSENERKRTRVYR